MASASRPWLPQGVILFSHGDVSYELLRELETRHHGETTLLARQRTARSIGGQLERVPQPLSTPLRDLLRRLLQREPSDRPASAAELEAELRACLSTLGTAYGATEAALEVRGSLAAARSRQEHVTATEPGVFPDCIPLATDDITTESGPRA